MVSHLLQPKKARLTKDVKRAEFYALYANFSHYGHIDLELPNTRLTSRNDGVEWLKRLVQECPLYADFFLQEKTGGKDDVGVL